MSIRVSTTPLVGVPILVGLASVLLPHSIRRPGMQVLGLGGLGLGEVAKRSIREFWEDDMLTYASAVAFQALVAIFPFVVFLVSLLSTLHAPSVFDWLLSQLSLILPGKVMAEVRAVVDQLRRQDHSNLLSLGILAAVWAASTGVRSLMHALDIAYDVDESRRWYVRYALSVLYTLLLAVVLIFAAGLMLLGPEVAESAAASVGLNQSFVVLWAWLRVPAAMLLAVLAIAAMYHLLPSVEDRFHVISPGSVLAVAAWVVASFGFSYYVSYFGRYNALYGSLGAVIVLLLYLYISAAALLLGGEVNGVIRAHICDQLEAMPTRRSEARS